MIPPNEPLLPTRPNRWACITYSNRGSSDQMRERCNDPKFKEEFREWLKREIEKYNYHGSKVFKKAFKTGDPTILPTHKQNDWFAYIEEKYNRGIGFFIRSLDEDVKPITANLPEEITPVDSDEDSEEMILKQKAEDEKKKEMEQLLLEEQVRKYNQEARERKKKRESKIKKEQTLLRRKKVKEENELRKKEVKSKAANTPLFNLYKKNEWEIHLERLDKFKKSKWGGEVFYVGKRGGIYTIRGNGIRDYRW